MKNILLISFLFCILHLTISAQVSIERIDNSPYPFSTVPDSLFLTSESYSYSEMLALQSLQGVLAQTKPAILRDTYSHKELVESHGIPLDTRYYNDFPGLLNHFSNQLDGYILCESKTASTNVAMSLSGIMNAIMIPDDIEPIAQAAGLNLLLDVRGKDETWLYANYGDQFSKKIASYQNVSDHRGLYLGDYSSFAQAIQFWSTSPNGSLATHIFDRLEDYGAVLGWGP
ncbi:MAG: GxGYxYP family putative glycoside hydrolase, partial [Bacteroidales bacterium]|nr:GxGYxYP family putative glycoside hydrolase [Bacteroidales bacterium]